MKILLMKLRKNNNGSTMVFAVVTILFLAMLVSLILALSATGFRVRTVDYGSRQTFYENEEYSGRIYSEVGMAAIGILGDAYTDTMAKLNTSSINTEEQLNNYLKKLYYKRMLIYFKLATSTISDTEVLNPIEIAAPADPAAVEATSPHGIIKTMLQKMADGTDVTSAVNVLINGKIEAHIVNASTGEYEPTIIIHDVHLDHVDNSNSYDSDITFDLVVGYPEWDFTFTNPSVAASDLDTFLDYIFITNGTLTFSKPKSTDSTIVSGCVSVGDNSAIADAASTNKGLHITNTADVSFKPNPDNLYDKMSIVVTDNVMIESPASGSSIMRVTGNDIGELWCNSILLQRATSDSSTTGSAFYSSNASIFVQDDLQLDGPYSRVELNNGRYYGYSYGSTENSNAQNFSSAIIVNGDYSSLQINTLNLLSINGLAYVNLVNKGTLYRTGESLTVRGNQDMYLVPDACMPVSNPYRTGASTSYTPEQIDNYVKTHLQDSSVFFGTQWLVTDNPFVKRTYDINGREYTFFYLNFKSVIAQREYAELVLGSGYGGVTGNVPRTSLEAVRSRVLENLSDMQNSSTSVINVSGTTQGYTQGAMVTVAQGGAAVGSETISTLDAASVVLEYGTLSNRYKLLKSCLISVPDQFSSAESITESLTNLSSFYSKDYIVKGINGGKRTTLNNGEFNRSAIYNIVDWNVLRTYASQESGDFTRNQDGVVIHYVYSPGSAYTVSSSGVYVVDGNVTVTGNVTGLIIASGDISVTAGSSFTSNALGIQTALTAAQKNETAAGGVAYSNVFKAFPIDNALPSTPKELQNLIYADVVGFDNWKKY